MEEHPFSFHVTLNSNKEYEIRDESDQRITNLPTMMHDQTDASHVCNIMEHLARFKLVRDLANNVPTGPFRESFNIQIISRSGEIFHPGCLVEVEHNDAVKFMFELVVENKGNQDHYLYVYNMGPCWQIENILRGNHEVVPPQHSSQGFTGMSKKKLKTMVPPEMREKGHRQCEDIIKVFVTSQPTSFDLLELPNSANRLRGTRLAELAEKVVVIHWRIGLH